MLFEEPKGRLFVRRGAVRRLATCLAVPVMAVLLAGCGAGGGTDVGPLGAGNAGGQGNFGSEMQTTTVATTGGGANPDASDYTCPPVQIRGGAAAWQVTDKSDGALRYQAQFGQIARECHFNRPDMTMRIGIEGRVLVGPKGGAGSLNVPLRLAVVQEGPTPKPIWTKLYHVPVQIGAEETQLDFSIVADDVTFPLPSPGALERYIVYLGFDPQAGGAEAKAKPKPARPKPVAATPAAPRATAPAPAQATAQPPAPRTITIAPDGSTTSSAPPAAAPVRQAPAPAPAASNDTQWIGSPAPSSGGFMTPSQ